jgi:two-component system, OmpR family, aerobic respiration control sensor histidine kinase ArcB
MQPDDRFQKIQEYIINTSAGNPTEKLEISDHYDEIDAIMAGINLLVDELKYRESKLLAFEHEKLKLEIAARKLSEENNINKSLFFDKMSHELRTPMNGIVGLVDLLSKDSNLNYDQKDSIDVIKKASFRMLNLLNGILDSSKLEQLGTQLKKEVTSVHKIVSDIIVLYSQMARDFGISLAYNISEKIPQNVLADTDRLTQVLSNLVTNSIKFGNKGVVLINISIEDTIGSSCIIKFEVTDEGNGITNTDQLKIFEKYKQLDNSGIKKLSGTGLGLPICKELVLLMGGSIGVVSEIGAGSKFWFTIKTEIIQKIENITDESKVVIRPLHFKILIAEDNDINTLLLKKILAKLECESVVAKNGLEAIELFEEGVFDLILMDIQMPKMDGIQATKILKSKYENVPPIIGLSANAFEEYAEKQIKEGLDDYISKPFTIDHLFLKMNYWNNKKKGLIV